MPRMPRVSRVGYKQMLALRRSFVAQYKAQRYKAEEIVEALATNHNIIIGVRTVERDIAACVEEWKQTMAEGIDAHKMQQWVALDEVERKGWLAGDYKTVLEAIRQKRGLMGTDAPTQSEQHLRMSAGPDLKYIEVPRPASAPAEPE